MPVPAPRSLRNDVSQQLPVSRKLYSVLPQIMLDGLAIVLAVVTWDRPEEKAALHALSQTCKAIRPSTLPFLFASVKWPLKERVVPSGPEFIPESLWPYIRSFSLEWPDEWSHRNNPYWGQFHHQYDADYDPSFNLIHSLVRSLDRMSSIQAFRLDCPFFLPVRLYAAIFRIPNLRTLALRDTPLYLPKSTLRCETLERVSLCPVSEALCVGNEARDPDLQDPNYYEYPHRSKCKLNVAFGYAATKTILWHVVLSHNLSRLEISTSLCSFQDLTLDALSSTTLKWPRLRTLIITGLVPPEPLNEGDRRRGHILDVISLMPALRDLRLLLGQQDGKASSIPKISLVKRGPNTRDNTVKAAALGNLKKLAVSLAVDTDGLFDHATQLEELAVLAIAQYPQTPVAVTCGGAIRLITSMHEGRAKAGASLRRLRLILEEQPTPALCEHIAAEAPNLEDLELEWRVYQEGRHSASWDDYASALAPLSDCLTSLRLGLSFPPSECSHKYDVAGRTRMATNDSILLPASQIGHLLCSREQCGLYFASRLPGLRNIGFEYRDKLKGSDSWDEWNVIRMSPSSSPTMALPVNGAADHYESPPASPSSSPCFMARLDINSSIFPVSQQVDPLPASSSLLPCCPQEISLPVSDNFTRSSSCKGSIALEMRRPVEYRFPEVWDAEDVGRRWVR